MSKNLFPISILILLFACTNTNSKTDGFITSKSNFEYKIISAEPIGTSIQKGDIVKVHLLQYIDDSLLNDTHLGMPEYIKIDSTLREFDYSEILPLMNVHDSAVCLFPTKEILKRVAADIHPPNFIKKGRVIKVYFKIEDKFSTDSLALVDYNFEKIKFDSAVEVKTKAGFMKADDELKIFIDGFGKLLTRLPNGVCIQWLEKGIGSKIKKGDSVAVIYKGALLNGTLFEETNAATPFILKSGNQEAVEGFDSGIGALSFGDKAKIIIPAKLAYGASRASDLIPPFSNLVFEVTVIKAY